MARSINLVSNPPWWVDPYTIDCGDVQRPGLVPRLNADQSYRKIGWFKPDSENQNKFLSIHHGRWCRFKTWLRRKVRRTVNAHSGDPPVH